MKLEMIDLAALKASDVNPRYQLTQIEELAASIKAHGILEPLVVRRSGKSLEILAGHRRAAAADGLGMKKVPCVIRPGREDANILHLVENNQRVDLTPLETALAVGAALRGKIKQKDLAAQLGRSEAWVSKAKTICEAYDKIPDEAINQQKVWQSATDGDRLYEAAVAMLNPQKAKPKKAKQTRLDIGSLTLEQLVEQLYQLSGAAGQLDKITANDNGFKVELFFRHEADSRKLFSYWNK